MLNKGALTITRIRYKISTAFVVAGFLTTVMVSRLHGQIIDDFMVQYAFMNITEAKVADQKLTPHFYRHYIQLEFGKGQATFGMLFQRATKDANTGSGNPENGIMLTSGYDFVLSRMFRIQAFGRVGITSGNDPGQPLYATDTDLRLNIIAFNTDGIAVMLNKQVFPSSYAGIIVNRYGRVQGIAGVGTWWNNFGIYATGYNSFNGCVDPFNPGKNAGQKFANLQNRGITLELTYEFADFKLGAKQNFGLINSGNDLLMSLQYRLFLGRP